MTKNGCVPLGGTEMYYAAFGSGSRTMAVLPGLSDGRATVNGKAWILSLPYRKYLRDYTVYLFSRKNVMPEGYTIRDMANDQVLAMKHYRQRCFHVGPPAQRFYLGNLRSGCQPSRHQQCC